MHQVFLTETQYKRQSKLSVYVQNPTTITHWNIVLQYCLQQVACAAYISYDLPDSRRVGGVEDVSHQHGLDRVPHNPGDGVRLQLLHQIIAERSCTERLCFI